MFAIILSLSTAFNQVVFVGKQPTKAELAKLCEHEYTLEVKNWSPEIVAVNEKLQPNLQLPQATHITGRVTDTPGSQVELRKYISPRRQVTVKTTTTDDNGRFDLGTVQKGKYRLLPSPTRAWKQPTKLECASENCELSIALQINATDLPDAGCPIRGKDIYVELKGRIEGNSDTTMAVGPQPDIKARQEIAFAGQ